MKNKRKLQTCTAAVHVCVDCDVRIQVHLIKAVSTDLDTILAQFETWSGLLSLASDPDVLGIQLNLQLHLPIVELENSGGHLVVNMGQLHVQCPADTNEFGRPLPSDQNLQNTKILVNYQGLSCSGASSECDAKSFEVISTPHTVRASVCLGGADVLSC